MKVDRASKMEPYINSVSQDWRWNYNTGGGQLLDWIGHHCATSRIGDWVFDRSAGVRNRGPG